jgi:hypothetical protein
MLTLRMRGRAWLARRAGMRQIRPVDRTARRFRSLRTVSAQWSLVGMFERSESPSHRSLVVNPIPQKPDIRGFYRSTTFSLLPIFELSRSGS